MLKMLIIVDSQIIVNHARLLRVKLQRAKDAKGASVAKPVNRASLTSANRNA